jgi:hypothetical protein
METHRSEPRQLRKIEPKPMPFAEVLTRESVIFLALEQWLAARPRVKMEIGRDESNGYWVCKVTYKGAFLMTGDDILLSAVLEATARMERISDGH